MRGLFLAGLMHTPMSNSAVPSSIRTRRIRIATLGAALCLAMALPVVTLAREGLTVGSVFPTFSAIDLADVTHNSREVRGRPTFVLAITDSDAGEAMRAWGEQAKRRLPPQAARLHLVALDLAFIVPTSTFLGRARSGTMRSLWSRTWADRSDKLRRDVGLPESETPFAFALDAEGVIVAAAHCNADEPAAEAVWRALEDLTASAPTSAAR